MNSPIKVLRESRGLTQEELASLAGVTRHVIIRNEHATYAEPSPSLVNFFIPDEFDIPERSSLLSDYQAYQSFVRRSNYGKLIEPPPDPVIEHPVGVGEFEELVMGRRVVSDKITEVEDLIVVHPFKHWRLASNLNLNQVSKFFCVHHALLTKLENQVNLVDDLPQPLISALLDSGYDLQTIDNERRWFKMYKEHLRARITLSSSEVE